MKLGKSVYLSSIELEDLEDLRNWRNKESYKKNFREYREISKTMQMKWFNGVVNNDSNTLMFSIRRIDDNRLLGACGLCYINWIQRHAELSLYIGADDVYIDSNGYAVEVCKLLFEYSFNQLNLNKVWAEIYEFDKNKVELFQNIGMNLDGKLRSNYYYDGEWWDSHIYSILKNEFMRGNYY